MRPPQVLTAVACSLLCAAALAAPTDPVVVTLPPDGVGAAFVPGIRLVADLERP